MRISKNYWSPTTWNSTTLAISPLSTSKDPPVSTRPKPRRAPWSFIEAGSSLVGNLPRYGGPAVSVIVPRDSLDSTIAAILAKVPGSRRIDASMLETIRIENGVARVGVDTTDKTIALEARLNRAISFNKGCYLGQETIERATARGGLKKRMFGLKFNTADVPAPARCLVSTARKSAA